MSSHTLWAMLGFAFPSAIREVYDSFSAPSTDAEERFFTRIQLPSGVFKTTASHRLDDLDRLVFGLLPAERPLAIMDVAVSSGITTRDWSQQLAAAGVAHEMFAGDSHTEGQWLSFGWAEVLLDRNGRQVLYADMFGRGLDVSRVSRRSTLFVYAVKLLVRLSRLLRPSVRRVPLVSPRLRECAAITVVEDDIFASRIEMAGRFHVLRAANILNLGYFDDDHLRSAVANLRDRLRPDGLLIVCRTHPDGANHGTIFRLTDRASTAVARIGDGSEIEDLVIAQ
jgi:SAM-dependent methyltransferase